MTTQPKIAIIGAGPGGLALANILHTNQISFHLFEGDVSPTERNQGGTLDLHPHTGQLAIREAGLWNEFVRHARPEGDVLKMVNQKTGEVLWDGNGPDAIITSEDKKFDHRPEIDREVLHRILVTPLLPTGQIRWAAKLVEVVPNADKYDLHFKDGTIEVGFDLVVGTDGAWSHVRCLLTDTLPVYSGISLVEFWSYDVDLKNEWMSQYIGSGSLYSFGKDRAVQIQRLGDGSTRAYASLRIPESFLQDCNIDWTNPDTVRGEYVERYFGDCADDLKRVLLESDDKLVARPLYMLPIGFEWPTRPGVTLVGDAAHLMTPFAGVGVNAALTDALELSRAIIAHVKAPEQMSLTDAVRQYETEMFPRGRQFAEKTYRGLLSHFSDEGNGNMVAKLMTLKSRTQK